MQVKSPLARRRDINATSVKALAACTISVVARLSATYLLWRLKTISSYGDVRRIYSSCWRYIKASSLPFHHNIHLLDHYCFVQRPQNDKFHGSSKSCCGESTRRCTHDGSSGPGGTTQSEPLVDLSYCQRRRLCTA